MTPEEYGEKAVGLFTSGACCSQAVFGAFAEEYGVDAETAMLASVGLGGGVGRMRETCGTVTGAAMALGLAFGPDKPTVYAHVQHVGEAFRKECGSVVCRELLAGTGATTGGAPEARTAAYYKKRPCAELVRLAAELTAREIQSAAPAVPAAQEAASAVLAAAATPRIPLYVATHNAHKVAEIAAILPSCEILADDPAVEETGTTFAANALLKVRAIAARHPGAWCLADDSGLEVPSLGGAPGVHSARYAGEPSDTAANNALLLKNLADTSDRRARFVCCCAVVDPSGREQLFVGRCDGRIAEAPSGTGGFGYDPLFVPDGQRVSFARLGAKVKNTLSHRARALAQVARAVNDFALPLEPVRASLEKRGYAARIVTRDEAAAEVARAIASAESVGMGGSETMKELGAPAAIAAGGKRLTRGADCDLFLLSANALLTDGRIVNIDGNGNRLAASIGGPKRLLYAIGRNKLVSGGVAEAIARIRRCACPPNARRLGKSTPCALTGLCADCNSPERMCKVTGVFDRKPTGVAATVLLVDAELGY